MREGRSKRRRLMAGGGAAVLFLVLSVVPGYGQSMTGRWAATGKVMDNGGSERAMLELK